MTEIPNKKKKFIKRNFKKLSINELARQTSLKPNVIRSFIEEYNIEKTGKGRYSSVKLIRVKDSFTKRSIHVIGMWAIIIFLITFIVYTPALKNGFVNWDDNEYVYENSYIHSLNLQSLYWMLTAFHSDNWHPLTWFSHAVDYSFWGINPRGHHLTSIILHALNTLFVFLFIMQLIVRAKKNNGTQTPPSIPLSISTQATIVAGVTALLFGLHPLHVESVAWVSERKDLLCAFFLLSSILSYLAYISSGNKRNRWIWFNTCLVLFIFSLMSKPMAVTLPVILLIIDIYPLKRIYVHSVKIAPVVMEKIPFFALSIVSSIITITAQHSGGAIGSLEVYRLEARLLNGLRSLVFYLEKLIVPVKLVPFYPFPAHTHWLDVQYLVSGFLIIAITGGSLWLAKKGKYLLFTIWLYYLVTLLPALGIIQVGKQAAADRYTYLPSLSPFLLVGIVAVWIWGKITFTRNRKILMILFLVSICLVMSSLGYLTVQQIKIWNNSEVMWKHVINVFPKTAPTAYNNLGNAYGKKGKWDEAIVEYKQALYIAPLFENAHNNLGIAYGKKGKWDEAIVEYKQALYIAPFFANAHNNLGNAYVKKGRLDEAISEYKNALIIKPTLADVRINLGLVYAKKGSLDEAIAEFEQALSIKPRYAKAHYNMGTAYYKKGMLNEAISEYKKTLAINPNNAKAHYNLGITYYYNGNYTMAIVHGDKAVELGYSTQSELIKLLKLYR